MTGGASGIGRAMARRFAAAGVAVVVADRNGDGARLAAEEIARDGVRPIGTEVDVTDPVAVDATVPLAESPFGHLDTVCCNAGLAGYPRSGRRRRPVFAVNVKGVWHCARAAVPALRRRRRVDHRDGVGDGRAGASRWAGSPSRTTSPTPRCSSPRTPPASSPASSCRWTAGGASSVRNRARRPRPRRGELHHPRTTTVVNG